MQDEIFADTQFTELYTPQTTWPRRAEYRFYFDRVMAADSVLDIGCGTGELLHLAREAGHTGRLTGIDPAEAMLHHARTRSDIQWVHDDMTTVAWDREFDLIVMTGHAFQAIIDDETTAATLSGIQSALTNDGRFIVETRNPVYCAWEQWTPENVKEFTGPDGETVRTWHEVEPLDGDILRFTATYDSPAWPKPRTARSRIRFLSYEAVVTHLTNAGLAIEYQYGDWDLQPFDPANSPEIVAITKRA